MFELMIKIYKHHELAGSGGDPKFDLENSN